VTAQDKAKSQLEAPPTQCPRCKTLMKVRKCVPLPGRKFVDVDYRCDECGAEVLRAGNTNAKAGAARGGAQRVICHRAEHQGRYCQPSPCLCDGVI
jgi:hypothetical protein